MKRQMLNVSMLAVMLGAANLIVGCGGQKKTRRPAK